MNYIGSKRSLLPEIDRYLSSVLAERSADPQRFLDVFAGTGVVSQWARWRGFHVVAIDIQRYASITTTALLQRPSGPSSAGEREGSSGRPLFGIKEGQPELSLLPLIRDLEQRRGSPNHPFLEAYCQGGGAGRLYFSRENGRRIVGIREGISALRTQGEIGEREEALLLASLLEGMDRVANTASVYGAYLKELKSSARQVLALPIPRLVREDLPPGEARQGDARSMVEELRESGERFSLAYLDPPYNARQYGSNYHLLETVARWDLDSFEPRGKTGLRPLTESSSPYCSRSRALPEMRRLVASLPAHQILVSYNDEGLLTLEELEDALAAAGYEPRTRRLDYRRFRADRDSARRRYSRGRTTEYLILGRRS